MWSNRIPTLVERLEERRFEDLGARARRRARRWAKPVAKVSISIGIGTKLHLALARAALLGRDFAV